MRNKQMKILTAAILMAFFAAIAASSARADSVTLTLPAVSGSPGGAITIRGTITNNTAYTVYLNGENFTLGSSSFLNGDITDFFLNAPLSLAPDSNSGLIALSTFDVAPGTLGGTYSGNFLDIIGGTDPSDFTDVLASSNFSVNVAAVPTPEPAPLLLLGTGLFALVLLRRRRFVSNHARPTLHERS